MGHRYEIAWDSAEALIESTDAEVLVIFDCCHAGVLCRPAHRSAVGPNFEFLAACDAKGTTRKPGPSSFTAALIWGLEGLSTKSYFSSAQLCNTLIDAPNFPDDQFPRIFPRYRPSGQYITIAPLSPVRGSPSKQGQEIPHYRDEYDFDWEYVDLRFHFPKELNDDLFRQTAHTLSRVLHDGPSGLPAERISFRRKSSNIERVRAAANQWSTVVTARRQRSPSPSPVGSPLTPRQKLEWDAGTATAPGTPVLEAAVETCETTPLVATVERDSRERSTHGRILPPLKELIAHTGHAAFVMCHLVVDSVCAILLVRSASIMLWLAFHGEVRL